MQLLLLKVAGLKQNFPDKFPWPVAGGEKGKIGLFFFLCLLKIGESRASRKVKTEEQDLDVST